jgi:hypothetical protein
VLRCNEVAHQTVNMSQERYLNGVRCMSASYPLASELASR